MHPGHHCTKVVFSFLSVALTTGFFKGYAPYENLNFSTGTFDTLYDIISADFLQSYRSAQNREIPARQINFV